MSATRWTSRLLTICASIAMIVPLVGSAQSLSQVLDAEKQRTKLAQQSQQNIDKVVDDTRKKEEEYKRQDPRQEIPQECGLYHAGKFHIIFGKQFG